jgi:hypothetical protein
MTGLPSISMIPACLLVDAMEEIPPQALRPARPIDVS